jgi:Xaa-Pro aminopeptidase
MDHRARQKRFAELLEKEKLTSFLVTHMANVRYLCGFTGSAGVLASKDGEFVLFTDGRYSQQARQESAGAKIVIVKVAALTGAAEWIGQRRVSRIGFEAEHMSFAAIGGVKRLAPSLRLKPTSGLTEGLRMVKDGDEIQQMRAAVNLASKAFEGIVPDIKPGVSESSIAAEIEYLCRRLGAEGMSFDTLVASGKRSALPHGVASSNALPGNGFIIMDFGVILGGYCSDMTRTVHVGRPSAAVRAVYDAVLRAQLAGIAAVRPGAKPEEVDSAARKVLERAGLARYFTHSTGHGVGLEIHEPPGLRRAPKAKKYTAKSSGRTLKRDTLKPGMVITIEPGVYIPGKGGVRIEDMVLVTGGGCEVLTPTRKELIVI